jgi:protein-disulfide isomerase
MHYARTRINLAMAFLIWQTCALPGVVSAEQKSTFEGENPVVAVVAGRKEIRARDVEALFPSEMRSLRERFDALKKAGLETLIAHAVLELEAERRGTTLDDLLKSLVPSQIEIKDVDVEREYLETGRSLGIVNEAEARALLKLQMEAQRKVIAFRAAVAELRRQARVEIRDRDSLPANRAAAATLNAVGSSDARAVLVVFTDFECPYCRRAHESLQRAAKEFGTALMVVYKYLPLPNHRRAFAAAVAAECAGRQSRFWDYADRLFSSTELSDKELRRQAEALGLDLALFERCLASDEAASVVLGNMREAKSAGIEATPSLVLNGRNLKGFSTYEALKDEIDNEIRSQGERPRGVQ